MATQRQNDSVEELKFALEDLREFKGPDEINAVRGAFVSMRAKHADAPWASSMIDNFRREAITLGVDIPS